MKKDAKKKHGWIRVTVGPGFLTATERSVKFNLADRLFSLCVDARDVEGDLLRVTVLDENEAIDTVQLPRDLPGDGGSVIALPKGFVLPPEANQPTPEWMGLLRVHVRDLVDAAEDATEPPSTRRHSRRSCRRLIQMAELKIDAVLRSISGKATGWLAEIRAEEALGLQAQMGATLDAWRWLLGARDESEARAALVSLRMVDLLLLGLAQVHEGAKRDAPVVGVLLSLRATVEKWRASSADTGEAPAVSVPCADLNVLARRIDVAIEIVRRTPFLPPVPEGCDDA